MKLLEKLLLTGLVANAVTSTIAFAAAKKFTKEVENLREKPENKSYCETITVEGVEICIKEADHINGSALNGRAFNRTVTVTRPLKEKSYYKAVLDHEIGHIVYAPKLTIFSSQLDLYKCELKADEYSVKQGNLDELIKFRKECLLKTWFAPVQYNTVCLAKLLAIKYLKK